MVLLPLNLERSQKFSFCDAFGEVVLNQMIGLNLFWRVLDFFHIRSSYEGEIISEEDVWILSDS